mmetsp:Transcript_41043/g.66011  ORF Transcript_41043/g.66011 Transcript_41043/m.66011 type:complete len:259 (-) Transcript_41043:159-935(-)
MHDNLEYNPLWLAIFLSAPSSRNHVYPLRDWGMPLRIRSLSCLWLGHRWFFSRYFFISIHLFSRRRSRFFFFLARLLTLAFPIAAAISFISSAILVFIWLCFFLSVFSSSAIFSCGFTAGRRVDSSALAPLAILSILLSITPSASPSHSEPGRVASPCGDCNSDPNLSDFVIVDRAVVTVVTCELGPTVSVFILTSQLPASPFCCSTPFFSSVPEYSLRPCRLILERGRRIPSVFVTSRRAILKSATGFSTPSLATTT